MIKPQISFEKAYEIIDEISKSTLEIYAEKCDRENKFPKENFDVIKSYQLQALLIPKEYGGWGLNFFQYQKCLARLAQSCASTASAFNMHNIVIGSVADYKLDKLPVEVRERIERQIKHLFKLVVEDKKIFAAATTEPGIGARFSQVKTYFQKTDDGYILHGKKSFVTMASYADYYLVLANKKPVNNEPVNVHSLSYFLVPKNAIGVKINETWDVLGMRGTGSHEVIFDQVKLPFEAVFMGREGFALSKVMREPHWITGGYLGVYLGIMEAIFNFTKNYICTRSDYESKTGLAFKPLIQARIGDMYMLMNNARLNVYEAAEKVMRDPADITTHQAVYAAKYVLGETMPCLAHMALRTCGGSSISKSFALERYLRDASCGGLMPAVSDMCQTFLGQSVLAITDINIW